MILDKSTLVTKMQCAKTKNSQNIEMLERLWDKTLKLGIWKL